MNSLNYHYDDANSPFHHHSQLHYQILLCRFHQYIELAIFIEYDLFTISSLTEYESASSISMIRLHC